MMNDGSMSAYSDILFAQPNNTLTNIFNILTGNSHHNITSDSFLLPKSSCFTDKCKSLICEQTVFRIYLTIMDAPHTMIDKVFLL